MVELPWVQKFRCRPHCVNQAYISLNYFWKMYVITYRYLKIIHFFSFNDFYIYLYDGLLRNDESVKNALMFVSEIWDYKKGFTSISWITLHNAKNFLEKCNHVKSHVCLHEMFFRNFFHNVGAKRLFGEKEKYSKKCRFYTLTFSTIPQHLLMHN